MKPRVGLLFDYDWDQSAFAAMASGFAFRRSGFDLFSFPSNAQLIGFDLHRFAQRMVARGRTEGWSAVLSHHDQFGALAAALVAEGLGLPGARPESILAAQHKLYARKVLDQVAPEANLPFALLDISYGDPVPKGLHYPQFVKPVKAAFSVLSALVRSEDELTAHTRFGPYELWVIRRLVEPFDRVCRARLPEAGTAHRLMLEQPVPLGRHQFNLDGWVRAGEVHALGVVDAVVYPGTQAFQRWEYPSRLPTRIQARALDIARRFLGAIGYDLGLFNLEFFYDEAHDQITVIECNPRLASQFSDLYQRVDGLNPHRLSLALALGEDDPLAQARCPATATVAASLVYRSFAPDQVPSPPSRQQQAAWQAAFPDGLLFSMPKSGGALARDFKWTGSHRYGIVHLAAESPDALRERAEAASAMLGWPSPYLTGLDDPRSAHWADAPAVR